MLESLCDVWVELHQAHYAVDRIQSCLFGLTVPAISADGGGSGKVGEVAVAPPGVVRPPKLTCYFAMHLRRATLNDASQDLEVIDGSVWLC